MLEASFLLVIFLAEKAKKNTSVMYLKIFRKFQFCDKPINKENGSNEGQTKLTIHNVNTGNAIKILMLQCSKVTQVMPETHVIKVSSDFNKI